MKTEKYTEQLKRLPQRGKQVIAATKENEIVVYQAFNKGIADYAVANQQFGGDHYSFNRMSWIKPGFLWMMHRSGWAMKEQQQSILAITLPLHHFKTILSTATISAYDAALFATPADWRTALEQTDVRLQWDPDHDPFGKKLERKAIQIGMKGETLRLFCTKWITRIEDITAFVKKEYQNLQEKGLEELNVPVEEIVNLDNDIIKKRIGIEV